MENKRYDVCVFGGCSLDLTYYQKEDLSYSTVPDKVVPGGKGSNQAVAAARAGAKVVIISKIGKDNVGQRIIDNLQYNEVLTNNVEVVEGLANDRGDIYIDYTTKDNTIKRTNGAIDSFTVDMIEKYKSVLLNSKMVAAQLKIPKEVTIELINFCYRNQISLILTPCRPQKLSISDAENLDLIDKISYITANRKECETIFGTDNIEECVRKYPNKLIVTLGENGVIYNNGEETIHIKALKIPKIIDSTGAGDTFNGNLAYCLTNGYNLYDAIVRAQYASAMKMGVETAQAGMPWKNELEKFIKSYNSQTFDYYREFDTAYKAVIEAYELIKNKITILPKTKEDKSFVTESDLIVEKKIITEITKEFPNDNFLSEETNSNNQIKDRTWIIDPIDGTNHYMKNSIFFGIQLAFIAKKEIQFSIIYLPKLNELYYGIKGHGVYLNDNKLTLNNNIDAAHSIVEFCGSIHKMYDQKVQALETLIETPGFVAGFLHINACCVAFANLLSGRTNALILSTKKPWDIMPGIMLCKEAGIEKVDINNLALYTNVPEITAKLVKQKVK